MEENYRAKVSSGYLMSLLKSVATALIVTFIILFIASLLLCFTDFPEMYTLPSAIAATILGVFAGSSMAARNNPGKSLLSSLLTAFFYSFISFIIGSIIEGRVSVTLNTALFAAIALIIGAIASIVATRPKTNKSYNKTSKSMLDKLKSKSSPKSYNFKSGRL